MRTRRPFLTALGLTAGLLAASSALPSPAEAGQRALLIGIGAYQHIRPLIGPPRDLACSPQVTHVAFCSHDGDRRISDHFSNGNRLFTIASTGCKSMSMDVSDLLDRHLRHLQGLAEHVLERLSVVGDTVGVDHR